MSKIPDRISISKEDRDQYNKLKKINFFSDKTNKELFLFAMATGFHNGVSRELKGRDGWFLAKDMNFEDRTLLNSISFHHVQSPEVLTNIEEIYRIAEEYAHAGLELLMSEVTNIRFGTLSKHFEKKLIDEYKIHKKQVLDAIE